MQKGKLFVLSGPSGVGKNAVEHRLREWLPELKRVVTATTRSPRPHEVDGKHYHFLTKTRFQELVEEDAFLEWAVVHDQMYGTPKSSVQEALEDGQNLLLIIDVQGALHVKEHFPEATLIFLEPESMGQLKEHLEGRYRADPTDLQLRLENAQKELAMRDFYDEVVVNKEGELDKTAEAVAEVVRGKIGSVE